MEWINSLGLSEELQRLASIAFVIFLAFFGARHYFKGKVEGPKPAVVKEFGFTGQMADMGPVRELVEQAGLLIQQQVRTNMLMEAQAEKQGLTSKGLEDTASALNRLASAYEEQIRAQIREEELDDEVERRLELRLAREARERSEAAKLRRDQRALNRNPQKET